MRYFLLSCSFLFLYSCQNSVSHTDDTITQLEAEVEKAPTSDNQKALVDAYLKYADDHLTDKETSSNYLLKAGQVQVNSNHFASALELFKRILKDYHGTAAEPTAALEMAKLYEEKLNNVEGASSIYQAFQIAYPQRAAEVSNKVAATTPSLESRLETLGQQIYNDQTNRIDYKVANDFIGIAEIHALLLPDHPKSPEYLHDAGRTAGYMRTFPKSLELYQWVVNRYPNSEDAAHSMFMMGYTYDSDLKQYDDARKWYEKFLQQYPNDELAQSAQVLLSNLGVSDEEIIERLQEQSTN